MVTGMCGAAYGIHRLAAVRFAPRLKRALSQLAGLRTGDGPSAEAGGSGGTACSRLRAPADHAFEHARRHPARRT